MLIDEINEIDFGTDTEEKAKFTAGMNYILENIKDPPTHEVVYIALNKAPIDILEYFAQDKWFHVYTDQKEVPIYSKVAQEILTERIILGGTNKN